MFDLKVMETKEGIINLINGSSLPASVICYILREIEGMAEQTLQQQLQQQTAQKEQEQDVEVLEPEIVG